MNIQNKQATELRGVKKHKDIKGKALGYNHFTPIDNVDEMGKPALCEFHG